MIKGHPKLLRFIGIPTRAKTPTAFTMSPGSVGRTAAIFIQRDIKCPPLSKLQLADLDDTGIATVTRHLAKKYLTVTMEGEFRFGTIEGYRSKEAMPTEGRFGDADEGRQREIVNGLDHRVKELSVGAINVSRISSTNHDDDVLVEYMVNDYCSCSSIGDFKLDRAKELVARGNTIDAFVTYDLSALKKALREIIEERDDLKGRELFGRKITYGLKDRSWNIIGKLELDKERDAAEMWLKTAFVKPAVFSHEDEYRILILEPGQAGGLSSFIDSLIFEKDARIAKAIVASGTF